MILPFDREPDSVTYKVKFYNVSERNNYQTYNNIRRELHYHDLLFNRYIIKHSNPSLS